VALVTVLVTTVAGCGTTQPAAAPPGRARPTALSTPTRTTTPTARPAPGAAPPPWLGRRVLPRTDEGYGEIRPTPPALRRRRFTLPDTVPMLPGTGFASRVQRAPAAVLARSTWRPACPVRAQDLDWVRLTFRGFDADRHTGELLVNRRAAAPLVRVFHRLWNLRFPIEEMRITTRAEQVAPPTGDGNDTGAFNCRPTRGSTVWSQHAYGLAIDVNPFQNPYVKDAVVLPELASAYVDRSWHRPGMILARGAVVRAFATIGWQWGGDYRALKDLQHFSANGR